MSSRDFGGIYIDLYIYILVPKTNQIGLDNPGPKVVGMQALVDLLAAVVFSEISNT